MATKENLEEAFAGESQANRKYLAFARRAEREGFVNIARLFRATAEAETIHANSHMRVLGTVKTTEENLTGAMAGEEFEFKNMYPKFIEEAAAEKANAASISFKNDLSFHLSVSITLQFSEKITSEPLSINSTLLPSMVRFELSVSRESME